MPTKPTNLAGQYRALTDLSLRQSPDKKSPKYEQWHEWPAGTVFEPPKHMNIPKALERGIIEPADGVREIPGTVEERPDGSDVGEEVSDD